MQQMDYAAQDVVYLHKVYRIQQSVLSGTLKAEWIISIWRESADIPTIIPAENYYLKVGNLRDFPEQLNLLKLCLHGEKKLETRIDLGIELSSKRS